MQRLNKIVRRNSKRTYGVQLTLNIQNKIYWYNLSLYNVIICI